MDFKNTFKAAPNALSSESDTERVFVVIFMYSVLWATDSISQKFTKQIARQKSNKQNQHTTSAPQSFEPWEEKAN
jgi:hypothetical protein